MQGGVDLGLMVVLGLVSSLHCVTMCGPLIAVASAPLLQTGPGQHRFLAPLRWQTAYQLGRGISYTVLGATLGLIGTSLTSLFAARQVGGVVQLAVGLAIMALGVLQLSKTSVLGASPAESFLTRALRRLVTSGHGPGMLLLGALTGLLPCGVLYAALARAVAAHSALQGGLLLLAFWVGTVPLLLLVGLSSAKLMVRAGRYAGVLLFVAMLVTGIWLGLKGYRNLTAPVPAPGVVKRSGEVPPCHSGGDRLSR